ncbi:COG2154 Pterin-4a-carbinolamine dehydratase [Candidatus Methylopumilus universalis]|uniref:4a-hydroxytetrahydrobiopterin dehydratase n=1 Tax=Candidatus Methylopumilus universalis TaxID=2588536 RepID=UPI003BEF1FAB
MAYNAKEIEEKLTHKCTFWSYIFPSIERKFLTQNFDDSIRIANEIAEIANQLNHHPELVFKHNALIIRIHTHSASGITDKDFELAEKIDQLLSA